MKSPNTQNMNAEALDIDNETIAQTGESDTTKVEKPKAYNASDTNTTDYPTATFTVVISSDPNLTKRYDENAGAIIHH